MRLHWLRRPAFETERQSNLSSLRLVDLLHILLGAADPALLAVVAVVVVTVVSFFLPGMIAVIALTVLTL
jgi:hypothetical protein